MAHAENIGDLDHRTEPQQFLNASNALDDHTPFLNRQWLQDQLNSGAVLICDVQLERRELHRISGSQSPHQFVIARAQTAHFKAAIRIEGNLPRRSGPSRPR